MYGEDGMDGAFIERQKIETFGLDNEAFEHNYRVDVTDGKNGFLPNTLQIGVDDSSLELQMKLESLPDVERAYVHVDYETTHSPEHFWKKEL